MAKVFTIPVLPDPSRRRGKPRSQDPRYIEAQQLLVDAMKYLVQQDQDKNKDTRFRMSDRPGKPLPALT